MSSVDADDDNLTQEQRDAKDAADRKREEEEQAGQSRKNPLFRAALTNHASL